MRANNWRAALQIARQRSDLAQAMKDTDHPEHIEDLSKTCVHTLMLLETALCDCSIPSWSLKCSDDPQTITLLQQLMYQIEVSYHLCFGALNKLCRTIIGRQKRINVVYRMVMFFNKSLEHLETLCNIQAEQELGDRLQMRNKRARLLDDEYAVNKHLTRTLTSITQMEWQVGQPGHCDILEGMLFSILDHVGKLVSTAVFKEHVGASDQVGNITKEGPPTLVEAAKLQTRYLVPVLHAALGRSTTRKELIMKVLADNKSAGQVQPRASSLPSHDLVTKGRKLIQSALLKSAVGAEVLEGLKLPILPEDHVDYVPVGVDIRAEKYGSEWFLESVWALVGWELAAK